MSLPDEAVRADGESGNVEVFPVGHYTDVKVIPINGSGTLRGGTGTYSETSTFSAGKFDDDLPEVGTFYNIWGSHSGNLYHFPGWRCVASATTGDFRS